MNLFFGLQDIQWELSSVTDKQLESVVRTCLNEVGFGGLANLESLFFFLFLHKN